MGLVTGIIEVNAPPDVTFDVAKEVETYPDYMPDVKSVQVLDRRDDGFARVAWVGHVAVASINKEVKWIEDEWWNKNSLSSKFELVEGDYKKYGGHWKFKPAGQGTQIELTIDFDLGLPLVGPLIAKLLDKIMKDNIDGMLGAIKLKAESINN